jgi:hypothetical protein
MATLLLLYRTVLTAILSCESANLADSESVTAASSREGDLRGYIYIQPFEIFLESLPDSKGANAQQYTERESKSGQSGCICP